MLEKKKIVVLLTAALLAACGGGGNDPVASNTGDTSGGATTAPSTDTGGDATGSMPVFSDPQIPPTGTITLPPADETSTPPPAPADQQLVGQLAMVANQLVYVKTDRPAVYWAASVDNFESDQGMYDVASGSKDGDAGAPMPASAVAPAAPIAALGFRIQRFVQREADEQAIGDQTVVGRVAFNLIERDDSPALRASEVTENMRFVIDKVELATNAAGELISARVLEGAQMHITGRNANGTEVQEIIPVPANAVRLQSMEQVLDAYGDTSSVVLMLDLENAFSQAGARLAALEDIAGHFAMQVTLSPAQMIRPAEDASADTPALPLRQLVGPSITVHDQPPVTGAGISGNVWIRWYP